MVSMVSYSHLDISHVSKTILGGSRCFLFIWCCSRVSSLYLITDVAGADTQKQCQLWHHDVVMP